MSGIFCSICCENFNNFGKNEEVATECGHIYHNSCVKRWLQNSKRFTITISSQCALIHRKKIFFFC